METARQTQMRRALELAERGWGRVSPNPMVGALVVDDRDGSVLGEGWHEGPGTAHAEVMALAAAGDLARGATVVCTLEPCNHFGRTPPCTRALIDAGVARVVVATTDPNLGEDTPGLVELRDAGIEVEHGVMAAESRRLNRAFERHVTSGLPSVTLKMASSLDGKTAATDGSSRWITGEASRADVQRLRAWADAVVVGAGTAIADDPSLTVRDARFAEARCADAGRGRHRGSCAGHRPSVRRIGTDAGRHVRPHARSGGSADGPLREPTWRSSSATTPVPCRWPRSCITSGSETSRGCSSKGAPPSRGVWCGTA